MVRILILSLALVSSLAFADGATFITAGPALPTNSPVKKHLSERLDVVQLHAVTINRAAFGANVLTADFGKYHYRFVGTMQRPIMEGFESWSGKDGDALLSVTREVSTGNLGGGLQTIDHTFEFASNKAGSWVIETNRDLGPGTTPYIAPASRAASSAGGKP